MGKVKFFKYQGTGNDFVIIDNRKGQIQHDDKKLIAHLCGRKMGIGADGLILMEESDEFDFKMIYFNSDGTEGSLCGNGARCAVHMGRKLALFRQHTFFEAYDGIHEGRINDENIHIRLNPVQAIKNLNDAYEIDTGSPHFITFVDELEAVDVYNEGQKVRNSKAYKKEGINVNFAEIAAKNQLKLSTYERGVEDETLSCGTGVTATAIAYLHKIDAAEGMHSVHLLTHGGSLKVELEKTEDGLYKDIWLIGPAKCTFWGHVEVV